MYVKQIASTVAKQEESKGANMSKILLFIAALCFSFQAHSDGLKDLAGTLAGGAIHGMVVNGVAGATLQGVCETKYGAWACPLAAQAFAQTILDGDGESKSRGVGRQVDSGTFDFGGLGPGLGNPQDFLDNPDQLWQNPEMAVPTAQLGLEQLKDKGYNIDENGNVSTPGGGSVSASNATAGLSESEMEQLKKITAKVESKYRAVKMKVKTGGGGGGRMPASYSYEEPNFGNMFGRKKAGPQAAKTAGLSRMAGGEPIGVSIDNLFHMIHRRYKAKRDSKTFVDK